MKTNIFSLVILIALASLIAGVPALAANIFISPENINVKAGQSFDVTISIDPKNVSVYTVKADLSFPANLLELKSFTFSGTWIPLSQTGYDSVNNSAGIMIKTAGYPGGVAKSVILGTAQFRAKASGSGAITVTTNSFVYDAASQNVLSGMPIRSSVTVTQVAGTAAPAGGQEPPAASSELTPTGELTAADIESTPAANEGQTAPLSTSTPERSSFLAALISTFSFGTQKVWLAIAVALAVLLVVYAAYIMANRFNHRMKTKTR